MSDIPSAAVAPKTWRQQLLQEIKEYLRIITIVFLIATFMGTALGVAGSSMSPTLYGGSGLNLNAILTGDRIFIPKYETWLRRLGLMPGYQRGDIVIFREKEDSPLRQGYRKLVVKRVMAIPGDHIEIEQGQVYINGYALDESYITEDGGQLGMRSMAETIIPDGHYFMMGDNRNGSGDSRLYGPVPFMSITGRSAAVILPPLRDGKWNLKRLKIPETFDHVPEISVSK